MHQFNYGLLSDALIKGFCTLKCLNYIFLILRYFYKINLKDVQLDSQKTKFLKKILNLQGGCATPLNFPKLGVSGLKHTVKTNKDLGMSCYIQIKYSVFFPWKLFFNHVKIIFKNI